MFCWLHSLFPSCSLSPTLLFVLFVIFLCVLFLLHGSSSFSSTFPFPSLQCSTCSPGAPDPYRPTCQNRYNNTAAPWCFSYIYDPEGVLSTVPTVMSAWLGTHFGAFLCFFGGLLPSNIVILYTWQYLTYMKLVFNGLLFFFF